MQINDSKLNSYGRHNADISYNENQQCNMHNNVAQSGCFETPVIN